MAIIISDVIMEYIDEALDIDDLDNFGDFVSSVISALQVNDMMRTQTMVQLFLDLKQAYTQEQQYARREKIKSAIAHLEEDFPGVAQVA